MKGVLEVKHDKGFKRNGVSLSKTVLPLDYTGGFNSWITGVYGWVKDNSLNKTK